MRAWTVVVIAGCGRVGFESTTDGSTRDRSPDAIADASTPCTTFGPWSQPIHLDIGANLGDEVGPWLAPNELDLWFVAPAVGSAELRHVHRASTATHVFDAVSAQDLPGKCDELALSDDQLQIWFESFTSSRDLLHTSRSSVTAPFGPTDELFPSVCPGPMCQEGGPALTGDLTDMVLAISDGGTSDQTLRLWETQRATTSDAFPTPAPIAELEAGDVDYAPALSSDGLAMYWTHSFFGGPQTHWATRVDRSSPWVEQGVIAALPAEEDFGVSAMLVRDGRTIVFTHRGPSDVDRDLYVIERGCQ